MSLVLINGNDEISTTFAIIQQKYLEKLLELQKSNTHQININLQNDCTTVECANTVNEVIGDAPATSIARSSCNLFDPALFEPQTIKKIKRETTIDNQIVNFGFSPLRSVATVISNTPIVASTPPYHQLSSTTIADNNPFYLNDTNANANKVTPLKSPTLERLSGVLSTIKRVTNNFRFTSASPSTGNYVESSIATHKQYTDIQIASADKYPLAQQLNPMKFPSPSLINSPLRTHVMIQQHSTPSSTNTLHSPMNNGAVITSISKPVRINENVKRKESLVDKKLKTAAERKVEREKERIELLKQKERENNIKMERAVAQKKKIDEEMKKKRHDHYQRTLQKGKEINTHENTKHSPVLHPSKPSGNPESSNPHVSTNKNLLHSNQIAQVDTNDNGKSINSSLQPVLSNSNNSSLNLTIVSNERLNSPTTYTSRQESIQKTPTLPEILSENESDKSRKKQNNKLLLPLWSSTPEIKKILSTQSDLSIERIFGDPRPFNFKEIFERKQN